MSRVSWVVRGDAFVYHTRLIIVDISECHILIINLFTTRLGPALICNFSSRVFVFCFMHRSAPFCTPPSITDDDEGQHTQQQRSASGRHIATCGDRSKISVM